MVRLVRTTERSDDVAKGVPSCEADQTSLYLSSEECAGMRRAGGDCTPAYSPADGNTVQTEIQSTALSTCLTRLWSVMRH